MIRVFAAFCFVLGSVSLIAAPTLRVGSKTFTESRVLAETIAQIVETVAEANATAERKLGMGDTGILVEALSAGELDFYPEYTGTISHAIVKKPDLSDWAAIQTELGALGLVMSRPLGFNNTYALVARKDYAQRRNLTRLSQAAALPPSEIRFGVTPGF